MRIIAIGDIHGSTKWKDIVESEQFDKCVFIGDYFDCFENISAAEQIDNFKEIVDLKRKNTDKFIILIGNHDFHYMRGVTEYYSGYQTLHRIDIQEQLNIALNEKLLQICFIYKHLLFSHAGVTKTWCSNNNLDLNNLEESINGLLLKDLRAFYFTIGINNSFYGDDICQSPLWVRPNSLLKDAIDNYYQIVGHTETRYKIEEERYNLIDCLKTSGEYFIYDDSCILTKKIRSK